MWFGVMAKQGFVAKLELSNNNLTGDDNFGFWGAEEIGSKELASLAFVDLIVSECERDYLLFYIREREGEGQSLVSKRFTQPWSPSVLSPLSILSIVQAVSPSRWWR